MTGLYEIKFKDGRIFRVFCANGSQINRLQKSLAIRTTKTAIDYEITIISNGIHTISQFEKIIKTI
jgi:hypothetical protein